MLPVPVIFVLVDEQRRATYRAYRSLTVVGRDYPSTLRLKSEFISTTHCVLYWQDGRLWFVDLLSSNGTEKRGRRCDVDRLRLGKTVKLGDVRLGFARTSHEPWTVPAEEPAGLANLFKLNAPELAVTSVADSRGSISSSGSSLIGSDVLGVNFEDESDAAAAFTTDQYEAITEMQRQLEKQRTEWEHLREQEEQELSQQHQEVDKHFAEIQSWREQLSTRTDQLDQDLTDLAEGHAELDRKRRELNETRGRLERREQELEAQQTSLEKRSEDWRGGRSARPKNWLTSAAR